jgi:hypothetical protein
VIWNDCTVCRMAAEDLLPPVGRAQSPLPSFALPPSASGALRDNIRIHATTDGGRERQRMYV